MKNPMKFNRIPIASHGLHKHPFNFPTLTTANFFDVVPIWYQALHKGESARVKSSLFARTNATVLPSLVTGRVNYKAIFVPHRFVWKPYYYCDEGLSYTLADGTQTKFLDFIWAKNSDLSSAFVLNTNFCIEVTVNDPYDIVLYDANGTPADRYFAVTTMGHKVLRILMNLGSCPNFDVNDETPIKLLTLLAFIRAFMDYYFPKNYVGSSTYNLLFTQVNTEKVSFNAAECSILLVALSYCALGYYDNSLYDLAWDSPVAPNTYSGDNPVGIVDVTNDTNYAQVVTDRRSGTGAASPSTAAVRPNNGTPYVGGTASGTGTSATGVVTQYVIDALQSLNNYVKRHQLAGGHLLDRFLASRGQKLDNSVVNKSYFVGESDYELIISAVENNSDTNLGELAGKGIISSGDRPLSFEFNNVDDDGIAIIIACPIPDCDLPCNIDPFNLYVHQLDAYHPQFDKLGVEAVPNRCVRQSLLGVNNATNYSGVFGFLPRYYGYLAPKVRLSGDFAVFTRGATTLKGYHTFRETNFSGGQLAHDYSFMRADDADQYNRLFYSSKEDNIIIYNRWFGEALMQKLPLGDSYDWDDDEFNKKVTLMTGGNV